ncbi:GNAT family N-acetyltransferase [Glycocaulis sp.]|uniref:GNAT family N-acetyltransferase n=1 Tax=Glycocaulis sp. TaxID=1969725 RepID=UPI003D190DB6
MLIRPETEQDQTAVHRLTHAAFQRDDEARLVDLLRDKHGDEAISLVAEIPGNGLAGHIMLSPAPIVDEAGGVVINGLALAPVSVDPAGQRSGVGSALCRSALSCAQARGAPYVVLIGHPAYYPRFGFVPAGPLGIRCPYEGVPEEAFMIARLDRAAMEGVCGLVRFDSVFEGL